jgi:hypothetical protein
MPNVDSSNFIKHTLMDLKAHIDLNAVIVGAFHTPLSTIPRPSRQNINNEMLELNDTIDP